MKAFAGIAVAVWAVAAGSAFAGQVAIPSPSGQAEIRIEDDASRFSVLWRGETVVAASPLGLELDGAPAFGALTLERREDTSALTPGPIERVETLGSAESLPFERSRKGLEVHLPEGLAGSTAIVLKIRGNGLT